MSNPIGPGRAWVVAALLAQGCYGEPVTRVTARSLTAMSSGGLGEVWVVLDERGASLTEEDAVVDQNVYAVYHCIPQGCKRVSELSRAEVTRAENRP